MDIESKVAQVGQSHALRFQSELNAEQVARFHRQLAEVDWDELQRLIEQNDHATDWAAMAERALPPPAVGLDRQHPQYAREDALAAGETALRAGRVGVILVAGGQGTRLGFDPPKGLFPIGPLSQRTLFQMLCDRLLAVMRRYRVSIPLFVMTSPATDAETRAYFAENDRLGLDAEQLIIFCQGTMPAVDANSGKVLLQAKDSLALSPDGHGGLVAALERQGCLERARTAGIDLFFYAQVDNPLVELCDPESLGYHLLAKSQLTTQVVRKRFAKEKVGNVVEVDGKVQIIEYSDLPDSAAEQTNAAGELKLWAGNMAVHIINRDFLEQVRSSAEGLPFHRARKAVPYVDESGQQVSPQKPNAIKFERFIFDLLPLAERAFVVEVDPQKVFAPVKNADGAPVDTPEKCRAAMVNLHRSWLRQAGASVPDEVQIEIHPAWALDAEEAANRISRGQAFVADTYLR